MLTLVLAESSIERVPGQLVKHRSVIAHARRKRKDPTALILDRNYHHSAMSRLEERGVCPTSEKRGRPDIVFHVLLQAFGSPLNREGLLKTYVHTIEQKVIDVDPQIRLPRNYDRFIGLLEQLYESRSVPLGEKPLLRLRDCTLRQLMEETPGSTIVAFSTVGKPVTMRDACRFMVESRRPVVLIGGFAHSHFEDSTIQLADQVCSVDKEALDAWVIAARLVYEYECSIGLSQRRVQR